MNDPSRPPGTIILRYILAEIRASIRTARRRDLAWVFLGGGALAAYAIGIVLVGIRSQSESLLAANWIWWAALPAAMLVTGAAAGWGLARLAQSTAYAPFLKAQPLGRAERRRQASTAALTLGLPVVAIDGALIATMIGATGQTHPALWGVAATAIAIAGFLIAVAIRLRLPRRDRSLAEPGHDTGTRGLPIGLIDDRRPRWIGSWAASLAAGRFRPSPRSILSAISFAFVGVLLAMVSVVQSDPMPAVLGGVVGGVLVFMRTLRCAPLLSPILRASTLTFTRAVRGLARLPLILSVLFFTGMAAPAYAAEPGMAAVPLSGAIGLLTLNGIYTAFAAFFAGSRRLAAMTFIVALALTAYETLEYGGTAVFGLAALVTFLWMRARKAYRYG